MIKQVRNASSLNLLNPECISCTLRPLATNHRATKSKYSKKADQRYSTGILALYSMQMNALISPNPEVR